jgi:hypothetical protein
VICFFLLLSWSHFQRGLISRFFRTSSKFFELSILFIYDITNLIRTWGAYIPLNPYLWDTFWCLTSILILFILNLDDYIFASWLIFFIFFIYGDIDQLSSARFYALSPLCDHLFITTSWGISKSWDHFYINLMKITVLRFSRSYRFFWSNLLHSIISIFYFSINFLNL